MVRTQVSLREEQHRYLTSLARQSGASLSSLVRKAVDLLQQKDSTPTQRALDLLGAFEADRPDVSIRHDDYFTTGVEDSGESPR